MAMNFWEAQKRARSRTSLYIAIFLLMVVVVAVLAEYAMRYFAGDSYDPPLPYLGMFYMASTLLYAGFQYMMIGAYGGSYVAESVGGIRVDPANASPKEQQLLNIVEEVALASSLPVPPVYILPVGQINAFAAGLGTKDAAVAITEGSLVKLNRDELQGVIAHEFGHIYNGDMKISMRLAAMVAGFFFILYMGLRILQFSGGSRSRDDKKGNPAVIAALIFIVAGALTWLFGSILKSAVSREREYLADACAVQFTRNPQGISGALRKIGSDHKDDMPAEGMAFSHIYFDSRDGLEALFATHPPLAKRIAAIEGREYIPEEWNIPKE